MRSVIKNIASLVLIPLNIASFQALAIFLPIFSLRNSEFIFFSGGLILCIALYFKFPDKFSTPYIFAHETTHALFGLFFGNKIKKISIKKNSGYVLFGERTGFMVAISPYIFPFYAMFIAFIYFSLSFIFEMAPFRNYFLILEGFFLSFHLLKTISIMTSSIQSDFKQTKKPFFAYMFVFAINIVFFALILKMLFPYKIAIKAFFWASINNFFSILSYVWFLLTKLYNLAWKII